MDRREFVGTLAAVAAVSPLRGLRLERTTHLSKVGLQLYTVRDLMKADFEGTIAKVAGVGYKELEFAGYFDHTPAQVRALLDHHGLTQNGVELLITERRFTEEVDPVQIPSVGLWTHVHDFELRLL